MPTFWLVSLKSTLNDRDLFSSKNNIVALVGMIVVVVPVLSHSVRSLVSRAIVVKSSATWYTPQRKNGEEAKVAFYYAKYVKK